MTARDDILAALRARAPEDYPAADAGYMKRSIPKRATAEGVDRFALFTERATRRRAGVERLADVAALLGHVREVAKELGATEASIAPPLMELDWSAAGVAPRPHPPRSDELLAISQASCAIAETGTLVLSTDHFAHSASVLPNTHIVCLPSDLLLATMEDAFATLGRPLPRAVVFLTGVSSTGDIGLQLVVPAQGPTTVRIALVDSGLADLHA